MKFFAHVGLILLIILNQSCRRSSGDWWILDCYLFEKWGVIALSKYSSKKIKDVHLEGASLFNTSVLVQGRIEWVGEYQTYLIIQDEGARLLVDLTSHPKVPLKKAFNIGEEVRFAGKIKSGRKGLPHLAVSAFKTMN